MEWLAGWSVVICGTLCYHLWCTIRFRHLAKVASNWEIPRSSSHTRAVRKEQKQGTSAQILTWRKDASLQVVQSIAWLTNSGANVHQFKLLVKSEVKFQDYSQMYMTADFIQLPKGTLSLQYNSLLLPPPYTKQSSLILSKFETKTVKNKKTWNWKILDIHSQERSLFKKGQKVI